MKKKRSQTGFTLIETVMVILLIAILATVALPQFIDFRQEAKDAAIKGALGAMRSSVAIAVAAIALKEATGVSAYPAFSEMSTNAYDANHPVLSGTSILDAASGIPDNPWSKSSALPANKKRIYDCSALTKGQLLAFPNNDQGWCYHETTGQIWANSNLNGGGTTENNY